MIVSDGNFYTWEQMKTTYHFLTKKLKALESPHSLCAGLDIFEHNMGLTAHLFCFHGNNIQDNSVGRKKRIKR